MAAFRQVFSDGDERDRDTAIRDVARELGYARTGSRIRDALDGRMRAAVRRGIIYRNGDGYGIDCRSINEYTRDDLVQYLVSAIGSAWIERDEAIITAARYLGFRRTGRNIQAAFKSAINAAIRRGLIERDGAHRIRKVQ